MTHLDPLMPHSSPSHPPAFYNDLTGSVDHAWALLTAGATDRRAPFHTPALASVDQNGAPQVRTVVLRGANSAARTLRFHTDKRANKIAELADHPHIQMLFYDPAAKVQLRVSGQAAAHHNDDVAAAAWAGSQQQSQLCYRQAASPGVAADDPIAALTPLSSPGYENFVAVVLSVERIEWLYLAAAGHRRALFTWPQGTLEACWLAP